jgi:hypothetical protein
MSCHRYRFVRIEVMLTIAFTRIRTNRPERFLTTFAAALLLSVTHGFQSVAEPDDLTTLHNLILNFLHSMELSRREKGDLNGELANLMKSVITNYVPIYLGNQLLYWSGQYWEQSHPVFSERVKSKDLANDDLKIEMDMIAVSPFPR